MQRLGTLADGTPVVDRPDSHLEGHPEARALLPEAFARLSRTDFREGWWSGLLDLGRVLGLSRCVPVAPREPVFYARRPGRAGWTRFVLGPTGWPCTTLKVVLRECPEGAELRTAFVGGDTPPEPWSPGAGRTEETHARSVRFWQRHALVWDESVPGPTRRRAPRGYWTRALPILLT